MSREQIIRDTAYAIWQAEGKPTGRDAQHWKQAEGRVALSMTETPQTKAPAKVKATGAATNTVPAVKSPAKAAAKKKT